jgi:hypothetical protein
MRIGDATAEELVSSNARRKRSCAAHATCCLRVFLRVLEDIMTQATIAYLERRYQALEKEIAAALAQDPTNDLAIADLVSRKLIIADEIQHNLSKPPYPSV